MTQFLPFKLGEEVYALEVTAIQEVVEGGTVYDLPGSPEQVSGAIGFHGRILPVIDLPRLLGFAVKERAERLLVLVAEHGPLALAVDQLLPIFSADSVEDCLTQSRSEQDCICGVLRWQETMISLLDLQQLAFKIEQLCSDSGG